MSTERTQRIVLARHAETEWSLSGQHTGLTDIGLTDEGTRAGVLLGERLAGRRFDTVLSSSLQRARTTAQLAGFADPEIDDNLLEWDYGDYEGITTADIRRERPGWELWTDGAPNGETPEQVSKRADAIVERSARLCDGGCDAIMFGHGHMLTAIATRWMGLPIEDGRRLRLGTGSVSVLRWKRENRVLDVWNDQSHLGDGALGPLTSEAEGEQA